MVTFFVSVLVLLVAGSAFVMHKKLQEAKAQNAKLLSLNQSVRQVQERHIKHLELLTTRGVLEKDARKKLVALGNNYFVFQSVNEVNVAHFLEMTDIFSEAVSTALESTELDDERFAEILTILASKIPDSARDFSSGFYLNYVPGLLYEFSQALQEDSSSPSGNNETNVEPEVTEPETDSVTNNQDVAKG